MIKKHINILLFTYVAFLTSPAFAVFQKGKKLLGDIQTGLQGLSVVVVTIAVMWVGYKVLFGGSTLRECAPIIIGGILLAGASEIASLLVK
jgi:type IV secretion system protein VirB2